MLEEEREEREKNLIKSVKKIEDTLGFTNVILIIIGILIILSAI